MVHSPTPFKLPMPRDPGCSPPPDPPRPAPSSASSPASTMSPSWKRMPCAMSRQTGVRRSRNSRSIAKCLNSSVCALRITATASGSCSTASRCSYQPIASASSVKDAHSRANVRVRAGSSSGGSWYWSNPMPGTVRCPAMKLAVQLYTLRSKLADDVPGTLQALAQAGAEEVELAGLYDRTAEAMRTLLDAAGLTAASAHAPLERLESEPEAVLEEARTLGVGTVIVPWV